MTRIVLAWPDSALNGHAKGRPWSDEDDAQLKSIHGTMTLAQIADRIGRSKCAVRGRITRLGIAKRTFWTAEEEQAVRDLYEKAGPDGVLNLASFAKSLGRDSVSVSSKAKAMGLPTSYTRRVRESLKVRVRQFSSDDELRAHQSVVAKKRLADSGHPRGMAGKRHSQETIERISAASVAWWGTMSEEERAAHTQKTIDTIKAKGGRTVPQVQRGTWKAGWREVGGQRNYYRSRWEANYARYLQWLKDRGEIADWEYEPETFWFEAIKRGVRSYKPDFRVWENDGSSALHEVKGWMDSRSRTTLKRMAKYHPEEKVVLIDGRQYRAIRLKVMRLVPEWEDSARDARS